MKQSSNRPAGRLIPVFAANDGLDIKPGGSATLVLSLAKAAAARGQSVLVLDQMNGALMQEAGIIIGADLADVLAGRASILDAKYVDPDAHFTAMSVGETPLDDILGTLAALSLNYDWVFSGVKAGCTPAHVRLAGAADGALLLYDANADHFMRAYWMLDALRMRLPRFDPLVLACGPQAEGRETFEMLNATVRDFLGAKLTLGGHVKSREAAYALAPALLEFLSERAEPVLTAPRRESIKQHKSA